MTVPTPRGSLHVTDQPGEGPALILMHGFPDDSHIYDRLVPLLAPRRAVTFDFLGYGRSDRSEASAGDVANHDQDLAAVVDSLGIEQVALVAHDASGPVAIDYAINEPDRVSHLVLLNTYYGHAPMLRLPEMIRLFADEHFAPLADALVADLDQRLWLLQHTARRFGSEELDPAGIEAVSVMPQFFGDADIPDALAAIRGWTGTLFAELQRQDEQIATGQLASLDVPVALPFGELDEYLSPDLGRHLAGLFPRAELRLVEGASHWPQWDQPDAVAQLVKELAT
jgi:pimeloyl-ACP methyl ester carboxylesterase